MNWKICYCFWMFLCSDSLPVNYILSYISLHCVHSAGKTDPKTLERVTWVTFVHWVRLPPPCCYLHWWHTASMWRKWPVVLLGIYPVLLLFPPTVLYLQQQTSAKQACSKRQKKTPLTHTSGYTFMTNANLSHPTFQPKANPVKTYNTTSCYPINFTSLTLS